MVDQVESKLGRTPKVLELMGLPPESIQEVLTTQKDPARNPNRLFAADLAISMGCATPENKTIALITQAGKIAGAAVDDLYALKGDKTLTGLPQPYYTGKVANPTAIDAQQATANLAANMLKECAANRGLISGLGQKIEDMAALTRELQKSPALSGEQLARLNKATEFFAHHMQRTDPKRAEQIHLNDYLAEVTKQVTQGCANSVKTIEQSNATDVSRPNVGGADQQKGQQR